MHDLSSELSADQMVSLAERLATGTQGNGDRAAEEDLLRFFSPRIYAVLCVRTRDREASRDLLHDALIATLRALRQGQLRESEKLAAFVLGIARNTAQAFIRSAIRRREAPLAHGPGEDLMPSQQDDLENRERERQVAEALAALDPTDRQILQLTLVDGNKPGVIAQKLGLRSEVVRRMMVRETGHKR
jgi:RNA polymerase sigma factor (sigma-70 family)